MSKPGYPDALHVLCHDAGGDLHHVLAVACEPLPAWDPVVYLTDFAHQVLFPLPADAAEQEVAGTMAGRAFTTGQPVTSERDGSVRVWVPVVEQTEARTPDGEQFGLERLADLLERESASGRTAEELLRRLVRSMLDHQAGELRDDATLLLVQWTGT